ncbi:MAG: glutathionylspermidine synthase family protein [Bacilli bacterium]|nr:glutathionylspermidine synthase family protein [Bacilli bacterium]
MIKLVKIPAEAYSDYRYEVIFNGYKWDPQVGDANTVSEYVIVIDEETANNLESWGEVLSQETMLIEECLLKHPKIIKELGIPRIMRKALKSITNYERDKHIRLMRFDFHPTETGWNISEVNSDVPGGFAEASILPQIASKYVSEFLPGTNFVEVLLESFKHKVKEHGIIALVHATSYSDDRQVMQFIGDYFDAHGYRALYAAPDHLNWQNGYPRCVIGDQEIKVDGVLRFFPLEWLCNLPKRYRWQNYYNPNIPSCNHPIAILTQTKRFPLFLNKLDIDVQYWKKFLPRTIDPRKVDKEAGEWIYKPALGRVGEYITIKTVVSNDELKKVKRAVKKEPKNWVAQEMFHSKKVQATDGNSFHLCIGVFTVDGKRAGFYGRISPYPRIDAYAKDIPILIAKGDNDLGTKIY